MKTRTNLHLALYSSLTLALALVIWSPVPLQAQESAKGKKMMEGSTMESCKMMKEQKQKMMAAQRKEILDE